VMPSVVFGNGYFRRKWRDGFEPSHKLDAMSGRHTSIMAGGSICGTLVVASSSVAYWPPLVVVKPRRTPNHLDSSVPLCEK